MGELLALCGLLFFVALITVVGHGIWVLAAMLFRALSGEPEPERSPPPPEPRRDPRTVELRELEITRRQVQEMRDRGELVADMVESIERALDRRRRSLRREPELAIEDLIERTSEPGDLSADQRRRALAWYRQLSAEQERSLPISARLFIARLLRLAGLASRSLAVYSDLLEAYPKNPSRGDIALEAARFAAQEGQTSSALGLLRFALVGPLSAEQRREAETLQARLEAPAVEKVASVPAPPQPVAAPLAEEKQAGSSPHVTPAPAEILDAVLVEEPSPVAVSTSPRLVERQPTPPPPPRRSWTDVLAGFMEDRNILWGELVGGLLIVGCSIALVLTLWRSLEELPYFPFLIFSSITLALFGAGQYTLHHWRLTATSRGLLVIATLLTPLNLLVLAGTAPPGARGWLDYAVQGAALLVFTAVIRAAGRDLIGTSVLPGPLDRRWLLALAVVGAAGSGLLAPYLLETGQVPHFWGPFLALASLPVACQALAVGAVLGGLALYGRRDTRRLDAPQAIALFVFTGLATFALLSALGFLLTRIEDVGTALQFLAVPLAVAGLPVLGAGLLAHQCLEGEETSGLRTTGTAIALAGLGIMLASVVLAWPAPVPLLLACGFNGVVLTLIAFAGRAPWAHAGAFPCLALAVVLGFHVLTGGLSVHPEQTTASWLIEKLLSAPSGVVLAVIALVSIVLAEGLVRVGQRDQASASALGSAGTALFALVLATINSLERPYTAAVVYALVALGGLAANLRWPYRALTWIGSAVGLVALVQYLAISPVSEIVPLPLPAALLAHAALALAGAVVARSNNDRGELFAGPLLWSVQLSSVMAVPLLFTAGHDLAPVRASYSAVLALLWLAVAWLAWSPGWFTAFQAALSATVLFGVSVWIERQPWGPLDGRALQAYGIGLALLGLGWAVARPISARHERWRELWGAAWPSLDRLVLGFLVLAQAALVAARNLPDVLSELTPANRLLGQELSREPAAVYGLSAWVLLGALAAVLFTNFVCAVTEGQRYRSVLGLLVLALTVPVVWAGPHAVDLAVASALRWGLATAFVVCSALVWLREPLGQMARRLVLDGAAPPDETAVPQTWGLPVVTWAYGLLVAAVLVVLALTTGVAAIGFTGHVPAGPLPDSIFARLGWSLSNVGPLALLALGLVGTAMRERSAGYAFAAGLVANATVVGGYALAVITSGGALGTAETAHVYQLGSLTAGLWAIGWLLGRRYGLGNAALTPALLLVQIGLAASGNVFLLVRALLAPTGPFLLRDAWAIEVGSPLGWAAALAAVVALALLLQQRSGPVPWSLPFWAGLGPLVLIACSVERLAPGWGHRALLIGTASYGLLWALALFEDRARSLFTDLSDLPVSIGLVHVLPVLAGIAALSSLGDRLWPAVALVLMSATWGLLAAARQREEMAIAGGALFNLALSLVTWHFYRAHDLGEWWPALGLVNVTASATVALLWLALRRWVLEPIKWGPLLAVQSLFGLELLAVLALVPLGLLLGEPGAPLDWEFHVLGRAGWLALIVATAAGLAYSQLAPVWRIHIVGVASLIAGVLAACLASPWDTLDRWLSFHVLTGCWGALALGAMVAGPLVGHDRLTNWFPPQAVRRWLEALALALVVLALRHGWEGPARPYVPAATALVACVLVGALALWYQRDHCSDVSGGVFVLAGLLLWVQWGDGNLVSCWLTVIVCLALASAFWSAIDWAFPVPFDSSRTNPLPFGHYAALLSLVLAGSSVGVALTCDLFSAPFVTGWLGWGALAAVGLALGVTLGDKRAWFARPGLYVLGLAVIGLALHDLYRGPEWLGWWAMLALALYVPLAELVSWQVGEEQPRPWFLPTQAAVAGVVLALSVWACLSFADLGERLAGPLAVLVLVPTVLLRPSWRAHPAFIRTALLLGAVALAEAGWAIPAPDGAAPWLHRNVLMLAAFVVAMLLYSDAPSRSLPAPWGDEGRRIGLLLGALAVLLVPLLLLQEFTLFDRVTKRTPLEAPAILTVLLSMMALMVTAIRFAVVAERDPLKLSERGRGLYVYVTEGLLVLLFVHVRLCVPELFRMGWVGQYWTIVVMLIAFLGVGLSELFERRGLTVLARPLQRTGVFLPLIPLLAIWLRPPTALLAFADESAPGLRPMLNYLKDLPLRFDRYALLWVLASGLYAVVALSRRSFRWALFAALAANFGLWSLLAHHGIALLTHPQAWLIPLALIILVSEHINRDRLSPQLAVGLRYLGICLVYVASTADLFIAGIGASLWLPIVLAALCVAGVLAGILLRVKAFLFLGVGFLLLDVFTMIWHAAVDRSQTWLWWASGIVLGVAILTLFAVFEKRRNDVLQLVERIKRWD
jgi:hypothetical protein